MFSIKNSFVDCMSCPLLSAPSCILETNCKYLSDVEVVFCAENPGKEEIEKGKPLVGKAGKLYRKYHRKYHIDKFKYLLLNCVLCATIGPDGKTGNPSDEVIERCKINCFKIIEACNPKLIVLMGTSPMKAFGIAESGITDPSLRGNFFKWNNFKVLLTVHPSYVLRSRSFEDKFEEDISKAVEYLGSKIQAKEINKIERKEKGIHYYKIPSHFYNEEYRLVDVQFLNRSNEILYIFRDKNNDKVFHKEDDSYFCYQSNKDIENRKIVQFEKLFQIKVNYKQKVGLDSEITYDGDIPLALKHARDYYLQSKNEFENDNLNIMFHDIEVYSNSKEFPNPEDVKYPVCLISFYLNKKLTSYVVDPRVILSDKNAKSITESDEVKVFKNEKDLLTSFIKVIKENNGPDILTGWNCTGFDLHYLYNRCKKLNIPQYSLSRFSEAYVDYETADIPGIVILDQLNLYKKFTFTKKESYTLDHISQEELGRGKLYSGANFSQLFKEDPEEAIKYNREDVMICFDLEKKVKHIQLMNEIRKICKANFKSVSSPMGQLDALIVSFLKSKNLAAKNSNVHELPERFEGAFVKEPSKGIHDYIVDFDFSSLYPSLILTYNIGINTFAMRFKESSYGYEFVYDRKNLPNEIDIIVDPEFKKIEMKVKKDELIKRIEKENFTYTINGCFFKPHEKEISIYSQVLEYLLSSRKQYKQMMFEAKQDGDKNKTDLFDIRQQVFKDLANALYGILGNNSFRFFSRECARSITLSGQEVLKTSILYADRFVESLKDNSFVEPELLNKQEIFGDMIRETPFIITGDTDSVFVTFENLLKSNLTNGEILEKVNNWCLQIQNFLNDRVIKNIIKLHNVNPERSWLDLKNELVIKRGLFLAKKRYSIYVISQEGRKVDEIRNMGLEIKRSDFPSFSKECLSNLLDLILRSEKVSINKLFQFVENRKIDFLTKIRGGDKTVARPISWTQKIDKYKKVPQGVIAMQNWNLLEYNIFDVGSKAYLFKLQGIDLEKAPENVVKIYNDKFLGIGKEIEVIALPDEEKSLPSYYIVDEKSMLKFAWEDRVSLLLQPLTQVKEEILTI